MLWGQLEILRHLDPAQKDRLEQNQKILECGYEGYYSQVAEHIDSESVSVQDCAEVAEILNMYRAIGASQKATEIASGHAWSKFRGFDGNEEVDHCSLATFLLDVRQDWSELAECPRNSHSPTLKKYRSMLRVWERHGSGHQLTAKQVEEIVTAD
jgi:uncharacterized protein YfbU (UPF0304 family)